ncbi:type IA DNA topoisomerase [Bacteroides uniformis]|uniref:DNA topoisomerase n=1 Tax=Bacteroides uniformis TaxID=820 RepID=A0A7J5GCT7_BACUN|nr:type IA DNA topoisomerase [Bacteroides uniformis]KAB4086807.1 type IA DNA topoisomerase [Bacteroides uniformis]KAB4089086.1 type IA DNA topoisomerase [Bacteroides uniformis]KAB4098577.1 type IA DNA topoisomerase [Bacteroides uniformis]KAB4099247.1 type IA DNA topoisomerase [Bacteroides uniformis]
MKTIIAEKPSVAREIARIVGATKREEGYFEGGGYAVTWAFGHLVQLAMPDGYGIRGFVRDNLPVIPDTFTLVPRQVKTEKGYKPDSGVVAQIKTVTRLFKESEQIIVATDAGREGELIFRYLYHYTGCTTPFVRLWISSLTDKAIRKGLRNLEAGGKYDNLYLAAKARSESDWLVGINGTQALSIAAGHGTYSVGRVQTPTLAMVCARYRENRRFTPEVFWQLHIATDGCDEGTVKFSSSEKWKEKEPATELYDKVKSAGTATVTKAERKEKTEETPLLYDLTTLQKEANAKHGFTAEQTLEIAQKLYEKKLITYPRTGSRYIPEDVFAEIPKLLAFIGALPEWKGKVQPKAVPTRRSVDGGKVTDHHALLVTGEKPLFLSKEDSTVYQMVAGRMIEAFSEKCVKDTATVTAECAGVEFTVKGSVIRQAGWRAVYGEDNKEETAIPDWREGDTLTLKGCSITEGKTKPKPLHTEATLLSAMETAGKDIEDDALRQALKDCGIGTPATRAAIIETLFKRGYMERCKKSLVPTEKGLALYSVVKTMRIADVAMTGEWEKNLARIERGELPADTFRMEIEAHTREITSELLSCDKLFSRRDSGCKCPKCGTGSMQFYGKVVRCDNAECGLPVFRLKANRTLSDDEIKELLTDGHTKLLKGFKSKQGKSFDAIVAFDGEYNTTFVFPERKTSRKFSGRKK